MQRKKKSRPKNVNSKCGIITDVWIYQEKRSKTSKNVNKQNKNKILFPNRPNYFFGKVPRGILPSDPRVDE